VTLDDVRRATDADFEVAADLRTISL